MFIFYSCNVYVFVLLINVLFEKNMNFILDEEINIFFIRLIFYNDVFKCIGFC